MLLSFFGTGLEVAQVTSSRIPLATTQSHADTQLQGRLGNVVLLCVLEGGNRISEQLPIFATDSFNVTLSRQQLNDLY